MSGCEVGKMTAYTASLLEAGIAEGEEKLSRLLQQLLSLGRTDDVAKATLDYSR